MYNNPTLIEALSLVGINSYNSDGILKKFEEITNELEQIWWKLHWFQQNFLKVMFPEIREMQFTKVKNKNINKRLN